MSVSRRSRRRVTACRPCASSRSSPGTRSGRSPRSSRPTERQGRPHGDPRPMISLSSDRADLATAFGVHRALDTAGACWGRCSPSGCSRSHPTRVRRRPRAAAARPRRVCRVPVALPRRDAHRVQEAEPDRLAPARPRPRHRLRDAPVGGPLLDDQVDGLDNATILYGLANDIWRVGADGTGRPRLYLADARSPAVVR